MNARISDAAVEAFDRAYCDAWRESTISFPGRTISFHVREANRAAIEDALPHLQPAKPEAVRLRDELRERGTLAATLRAMATNYSGGHSWDHLDADVCRRAADALVSVQPSPAGQGDVLQPCPFCGESLTINGVGDGVHPRDSACILAQHVVVVDHAPHVEAWNRRALAARQPMASNQIVENIEQLGVDGKALG